MKEFVRKNAFKRDKIVHNDILGRSDENSHTGKSVTIETDTIYDKELTDVQKLANKVDSLNNSINEILTVVEDISEHVSSDNNPHPVTTTQEFADTQITSLATEATYTPAVWAYLVGLFTTVPKSVKEHFVEQWNRIFDLNSRVGLFEDNSYLDRFKVPTKHLVSGEYFNSAKTSGGSAGTVALAANTIIMTPIAVSDDIEVEVLYSRVYVATDGHFVMGIYEGNSFYPYSLIWQSESISQSVAGVKGSLTTNVVLRKNKLYWIAYLSDNNDAKMYTFQYFMIPAIQGFNLLSTAMYNVLTVSYHYAAMPINLEGLVINLSYSANVMAYNFKVK